MTRSLFQHLPQGRQQPVNIVGMIVGVDRNPDVWAALPLNDRHFDPKLLPEATPDDLGIAGR